MAFIKRIATGASAAVVAFSSVLTLMVPTVAYAVTAQTCTWTGAGGDNKFSTAANWIDCSSAAPQAGDIIRFTTMMPTDVSLVNDLGVSLGGVVTLAQPKVSGSNAGFIVDTLSLVDGAAVSVEKASICNPYFSTVAFNTITALGNVSYDSRTINDLVATELDAVGSLTLLSGNGYSEFSTGSSASSIIVASPVAVTTATGCSTGWGSNPSSRDDFANFTYGSLTVQKGATVSLTNYSKPITFGGGTATSNPVVGFYATKNETKDYVDTSYTWTSPVTLLSHADVEVGEKVTANYTGTITGEGLQLKRTEFSAGAFNFNPSSNNTASQTGSQENPVKSTKLEGESATYVTVLGNETATLVGTRQGMQVSSGGVLLGTGTLTESLYVANGGIVSPGMSPGCLSVGTLSLEGTYRFEIAGTEACTSYDQIKVTQNTSTTSVTIHDTAVLETSRLDDYTPSQGAVFTIIDNQGPSAVDGTFSGLVEGATFEQNGIVFAISYVGGDGNDVTLTVQNVPTAPETGFEIIANNPIAMFAGFVAVSVGLVIIARKLQTIKR